MRPPISLGVVYGLVKELSKTRDRPLLVLGVLAEQLARELTAGGDARAVRTGGPPEDVEALVYILGGAVTEADERVLKLARRARVPTIVVAAGRELPERVPFVLATDIVRAEPGRGFPVETIAFALARKLGENATSLARHLPVLRPAVCETLIESFARKNAVISAAVFIPGVDFPVLTANQLRLVLRICASYGLQVDKDRAPEIVATIATGLGARAIARELVGAVPLAGWLIKGALAYAATKALGEAAVRYCETRTTPRPLGEASGASS